jgi:hypothetical protein
MAYHFPDQDGVWYTGAFSYNALIGDQLEPVTDHVQRERHGPTPGGGAKKPTPIKSGICTCIGFKSRCLQHAVYRPTLPSNI